MVVNGVSDWFQLACTAPDSVQYDRTHPPLWGGGNITCSMHAFN